MFRILEKATTGHGYELYTCWLTGQKAGMKMKSNDVKINETSLRGLSGIVCEHKIAGEWIPATDLETEEFLTDFNKIREEKGWAPATFDRLLEDSSGNPEEQTQLRSVLVRDDETVCIP